MRYVSKCFPIIALSCVLVTLTACSVAQPSADQRDRLIGTISNSVAVLPFESNSPELADFAADVYEEVLNQLAAVPDLYVVRRETILPYSSMNLDPEEIALQLGVGHVLGGSVEYLSIQPSRSEIVDTKSARRVLFTYVNYLYNHTGERSVVSQLSVHSRELSLSEIFSCQSVIASALAATVKELIFSESAYSPVEPVLPARCES